MSKREASPPPPSSHSSRRAPQKRREVDDYSDDLPTLPFSNKYRLDLPEMILKGLLEKAGCTEKPRDYILEIQLKRASKSK